MALRSVGDVVIQRRDGVFAYQLAVVVDDARQGITDVVRGADLMPSTPWQIALQRALGLPQPRYAHLPLVVEPNGSKLAKSQRSVAADARRAPALVHAALRLLQQEPPAGLEFEPVSEVLSWGIQNWNPKRFHGISQLTAR
jgi:glutamyl-Q tRNA(Asp) synthetase